MKIVIVGAGIMGLSTAWALTKRGHRVTLVEQGDTIPSSLAASGDQHRMIRRAYGGKAGYATLITEAYEAWEELWLDLGVSHYEAAGILCICQTEGDEADQFRQGFDAAGTSYERMSPAIAAARYRFLDPSTFRYAFHTPEGGVLFCQRIAADLAQWLTRNGADLRTGTRVTRLEAERGRVECADGETIEADLVVTTAGAWTLRLLPELAGDLQVYRTAVVYLDPPPDLRADWAAAPAILSIGGPSEGYVLPPVAGTGAEVRCWLHEAPGRRRGGREGAGTGRGRAPARCVLAAVRADPGLRGPRCRDLRLHVHAGSSASSPSASARSWPYRPVPGTAISSAPRSGGGWRTPWRDPTRGCCTVGSGPKPPGRSKPCRCVTARVARREGALSECRPTESRSVSRHRKRSST